MDDVEQTLASMVAARYVPLAGAVVVYDAKPPAISVAAPIYAIVQLLELGWGYYLPGIPTGRREAIWEVTLHGRRQSVLSAQETLPSALTGHYQNAERVLILGAFLSGMRSATRAEVPAGLAETILTFSSEVL